jgi:hypothetical protein
MQAPSRNAATAARPVPSSLHPLGQATARGATVQPSRPGAPKQPRSNRALRSVPQRRVYSVPSSRFAAVKRRGCALPHPRSRPARTSQGPHRRRSRRRSVSEWPRSSRSGAPASHSVQMRDVPADDVRQHRWERSVTGLHRIRTRSNASGRSPRPPGRHPTVVFCGKHDKRQRPRAGRRARSHSWSGRAPLSWGCAAHASRRSAPTSGRWISRARSSTRTSCLGVARTTVNAE